MKKFLLTILSTGSLIALLMSSTVYAGNTPKQAETSADASKATEISTYLQGAFMDEATAKSKLQEAGFEIVATYVPVKNGMTILFTDSALKTEAAKAGRAHVAVLRLFIDDEAKTISITNPVYFGKAFMQDEYNADVFSGELAKINKAFAGLSDSVDKMEFEKLSGFHFMMGMPYYEDADKVGEGETADLVAKAKAYKDGKLEIFEMKLSDNSYLIGYDLDERTKKFVQKIGRANAGILPYCIAIEDGKATALNAKFYIALSYPLLTMGEFMTISTVPGAIAKDLEKPFH